jgi:hypothetical protein
MRRAVAVSTQRRLFRSGALSRDSARISEGDFRCATPNSAEQKSGSIVLIQNTMGKNAVRNNNERVRLEMEILKYRNFLLFIEEKKFRLTLTEKIAELEEKLRQIDE